MNLTAEEHALIVKNRMDKAVKMLAAKPLYEIRSNFHYFWYNEKLTALRTLELFLDEKRAEIEKMKP